MTLVWSAKGGCSPLLFVIIIHNALWSRERNDLHSIDPIVSRAMDRVGGIDRHWPEIVSLFNRSQ